MCKNPVLVHLYECVCVGSGKKGFFKEKKFWGLTKHRASCWILGTQDPWVSENHGGVGWGRWWCTTTSWGSNVVLSLLSYIKLFSFITIIQMRSMRLREGMYLAQSSCNDSGASCNSWGDGEVLSSFTLKEISTCLPGNSFYWQLVHIAIGAYHPSS